jgi:hypothetical protein
MAATMRKRKSAHPSAKSKKAKAAEAKGANDGAVEANAKAGALEGGGVSTPFSPTNNASPPTISAIGVDDATAFDDNDHGNKGAGQG